MSVKVAIVTGAGTGIGRAICESLLVDGWQVALAGRRAERLQETARALDASGGRTLCHPTDVGDPERVDALFAAAVGRWGRVDLLVNNAGLSLPATPLEAVAPKDWHTIVAANLSGVFFCTQAAFRVMKGQSPRGGRIINNGSVSATTPRPHSAPYTATKHAVTGLTKAAALDGREFNIAVGQIDIGNAASDMTARMAEGVLQPDGRMMPEARMDVGHVARAVAHMASLPLDANVLFMTVMATRMPFVGRG